MMRLFNIEFRKILGYKPFLILMGFYFVTFSLVAYGITGMEFDANGQSIKLSTFPIFQFPDIWHNITYLASFFNIFIAFIIIMLTANDYVFKTLRQHLIDGLTRQEYLGGKFIIITTFSLVVTVFVALVTIVLGASNTVGFTFSKIFGGIEFLGAYFLETFAYLSLALLFGLLIRKSILSIGLFVMYTWLIERMLGWITGFEFLEYLPMGTMNKLIQFPLGKYLDGEVQEAVEMVDVGGTIFYIVLFAAGAFALLKYRDQ